MSTNAVCDVQFKDVVREKRRIAVGMGTGKELITGRQM